MARVNLSGLAAAEDNATASQIVGRQFDGHPIAAHDPNEVPPHAPGQMGVHLVTGLQLNLKHAVTESVDDLALDADGVFPAIFLESARHARP